MIIGLHRVDQCDHRLAGFGRQLLIRGGNLQLSAFRNHKQQNCGLRISLLESLIAKLVGEFGRLDYCTLRESFVKTLVRDVLSKQEPCPHALGGCFLPF